MAVAVTLFTAFVTAKDSCCATSLLWLRECRLQSMLLQLQTAGAAAAAGTASVLNISCQSTSL
jgi:hypothetical protein